jgi:hypothetical protein
MEDKRLKKNVNFKMKKGNIINNKNTFPFPGLRMSFHKLKIGSRKKDLSRPTLNSNEKVK